MGRYTLGCVVAGFIILAAATTRSDDVVSDPSPTTGATPEPITGTPAITEPGSEGFRRDPFSLYPVGPTPNDKSPKPLWRYEDLTPPEQANVDRNRDATGWAPIHDAFAAASAERAHQAAAASAAAQLGISNIGIGVVP